MRQDSSTAPTGESLQRRDRGHSGDLRPPGQRILHLPVPGPFAETAGSDRAPGDDATHHPREGQQPVPGQGHQPHGHGSGWERESRAPAGLLADGPTPEPKQLGLSRGSGAVASSPGPTPPPRRDRGSHPPDRPGLS